MMRRDYGEFKIYFGLDMKITNLLDCKVIYHLFFNYPFLGVRELMDKHMTYDKEKMMNVNEKDKKEKFIWSYIIRPVRKDFENK